jgi:hypothetical protein
MLVIVPDVLVEDVLQVPPVVDQEPVGALAAGCAHPALGIGVPAWGSRGTAQDPQTERGEDRVEAGHEFGVTIPDQERERGSTIVQIHGQVAGDLGDPDSRG